MKFKNKIVDKINPPPSKGQIANLEILLGAKLPEDYVDFIMKCNGGYADYEVNVSFKDGSSEYLGLNSFYSVSTGSWETNPFELLQCRNKKDFPPTGFLPIARDGGGSQLFLDLRDGGSGVVAHIHRLPEWTGRRQNDSVIVVANSFHGYWNSLTISDSYIREFIENYDPKNCDRESVEEWFDTGFEGWREKYKDLWEDKN